MGVCSNGGATGRGDVRERELAHGISVLRAAAEVERLATAETLAGAERDRRAARETEERLRAQIAAARDALDPRADKLAVSGSISRIARALAALTDAPTSTEPPLVTVRNMTETQAGPWRVFVGGYGVATWPSMPSQEDPQAYAEEVARCLRLALAALT